MGTFSVSRSTRIEASPGEVRTFVHDFRCWRVWSPWEDTDPEMDRTYAGPEVGVGARYGWEGNRKAGRGTMEIVADERDRIDIRLTFLKPWKAVNDVRFELTEVDGSDPATEVTWTMSGEQRGLSAWFGRIVPMDRLVGRDFERGLASLKRVVESDTPAD